MRRPPIISGNIGLPIVSINPAENAWNITHDPPIVGGCGISGNMDPATYNGYTMAPPYSRAVNSTNMSYAQQSPIIATGGLTYTYTKQSV